MLQTQRTSTSGSNATRSPWRVPRTSLPHHHIRTRTSHHPNREVDFVARTLTSSRHRAAYRNSYDMAFSLVSTVAFSAAATAPGRRVSSKRDVAMRAAKGFEMPKQYKKVSFLP